MPTTHNPSDESDSPVLVTGATGRQGGAVARTLLAQGRAVRALTRDKTSPASRELSRLGAEVVEGDLADQTSVRDAVAGTRAIFSVQAPSASSPDEVLQGTNLVTACRDADVQQIVHTSVSGVDLYRQLDGWNADRWGEYYEAYWLQKANVEDLVRSSGVPHWTILRPGTFMQDFAPPSPYRANGTSNQILTVRDVEKKLPLIEVTNIGQAAVAAFNDPQKFHQVVLELASDWLSYKEIAAVLSEVTGEAVTAPPTSPTEAEALGLDPMFMQSQFYLDDNPLPARPEYAQALGLETTTFREWAVQALGSQRRDEVKA